MSTDRFDKYLQDVKAEYDAGQDLYPALLSREDVLSDIHGWIDQLGDVVKGNGTPAQFERVLVSIAATTLRSLMEVARKEGKL